MRKHENPGPILKTTQYPVGDAPSIEPRRVGVLTRAQEIGVTIGGSVDRSVAGESGDEYFIRWRGQRRFLDQHLGRGGSRDPRFTLRIYYTWDEETSCVVVGWLPTHLSTSGS